MHQLCFSAVEATRRLVPRFFQSQRENLERLSRRACTWMPKYLSTKLRNFENVNCTIPAQILRSILIDYCQIIVNAAFTLMAAMLGAGAGAWFAFRLERKAKKQDKKESNVDAILDAMLSLSIMWNEVWKYRKQIINPCRDHPLRHIQIAATITTSEKFNIPWGRLVFLMPENSDLLLRAKDIQLTFLQLNQSIKDRSHEHLYDVQPKICEAGLDNPGGEEIREILGQKLFESMKNRTDGIIRLVDWLHNHLPPLIDVLRTTTITIYPDAKIPDLKPTESSEYTSD